MQAIIDLSQCPFYLEKVAGVHIIMRHIISLCRNNIEKIIICGMEKPLYLNSRKDKRITCSVLFVQNFSQALSQSSGDSFIVAQDVVYSQGIFNLNIDNQKSGILRLGGLNVFFVRNLDKNKFNNLEEIAAHAVNIPLQEVFYRAIDNKNAIKKAEKEMVQGLRTSGDTLISRLMNRTISLWVTARIMHYNITPNFITTFNLFLGIAAVACVWLVPGYWKQAVAGTLFHLSSVLDGCDGEIARLKFLGSKFGAKYDDFSDEFTNFLFYPGVAIYVSVFWITDIYTTLCTIIGTAFYTIGKLIYFWLNSRVFHIDNVKYLQFYFEKRKENWGKNPILWIFKIGRHIVRNDFLALLAMVTGFLQLYWTAPYVVFVFGTAYFAAIFLELINHLKKRSAINQA